MKDICSSIKDYNEWLKEQPGSLSEVAGSLADRAIEADKDVKAFIYIDKDDLESKAKDISEGKLYGVPVSIKNNMCIKGQLTTCASKVLDGFRPPYNATVIEKLNSAGALIFAGANMDEFAFGSSCENSCYGPTKNPWDTSRIPGGSSGGAAASVSSGEVVASLGSDTGGSIRQPASLCGVVGFKPTYGRVSRYGLIAFASSLDQIGPITRNVTDCAKMLEVISGYDPKDSTSVNIEVPSFTDSLGKDIKGMTIGVAEESFQEGVDAEVVTRIKESIKVFEDLGANIVSISLPNSKYAVSCYYIIGPAEASSNLGRYDGAHYGHRAQDVEGMIDMYIKTRTEGFGDEAKRRVLLGTYALSSGYYEAYYLKAQKVRTLIADDFKKAFETCNAVLTPTSPTTAFKLGERMDDPLQMYLSDIFTIPANLAGLPAISVPCGFGENNMPVGLQLMAKPFAEETLLQLAHAFERSTPHSKNKPSMLKN